MKQIRALIPVLLLLVLLGGCAHSAQDPVPTATPEPTPAPPDFGGLLRISEVGVKNKASFFHAGFPDWVELESTSAEPLALDGWTLSDKPGAGGLELNGSLGPGGLLLLPLNRADFGLSRGETLWLRAPDGSEQDSVLLVEDRADFSLQRQPDGSRHPFDQFIVSKTPAARWGNVEDLMGPAVFLASDASDFVNGHILYVDGGILAYIGKQP